MQQPQLVEQSRGAIELLTPLPEGLERLLEARRIAGGDQIAGDGVADERGLDVRVDAVELAWVEPAHAGGELHPGAHQLEPLVVPAAQLAEPWADFAGQPARDDPITSLETVQGVALRPDRLTPRDDRCVQAHGPS